MHNKNMKFRKNTVTKGQQRRRDRALVSEIQKSLHELKQSQPSISQPSSSKNESLTENNIKSLPECNFIHDTIPELPELELNANSRDIVSSNDVLYDCVPSEFFLDDDRSLLINETIKHKLKEIKIKYNIKCVAIDEVLRLFRYAGHEVPLSHKTLFKNEVELQHVHFKENSNCMQTYFGITHNLISCFEFKRLDYKIDRHIGLIINFDGIEINRQLHAWPILIKIIDKDLDPMCVSFTSIRNSTKPSNAIEYFDEFVHELQRLATEGFVYKDTKIYVDLKKSFVICDAPARAFAKLMKGHAGYSSCDFCVLPVAIRTKVKHPHYIGTLRTDKDFRTKSDTVHNNVGDHDSPFTLLDIADESLRIACVLPLQFVLKCIQWVLQYAIINIEYQV